MNGLVRDTFAELIDRKIIYALGLVTLVAMFIIYVSGSVGGQVEVRMGGFESDNPLTETAEGLILDGFSSFISFMIFLVVMATAGLIPRMLEKGRAEYYLSKPVTRGSLILRKIASIWIVYGLAIMFCGFLVLMVMRVAHGFVGWGAVYILVEGFVILSVWLSVTSLAGVVFNSTGLAMMTAFGVWVAQQLLSYYETISGLTDSKVIEVAVTGLYYILPKTSSSADLATDLAKDYPIDSWMPLWSSLLFGFVLVVATVYLFRHRDY